MSLAAKPYRSPFGIFRQHLSGFGLYGAIGVVFVTLPIMASSDKSELPIDRGSSTRQEDRDRSAQLYKEVISDLLIDNCYECHSKAEDRIESGLQMDDPEAFRDGGDRGLAIEPGDPEDSLLMIALHYEEDDLQMPPSGKLSGDEIEKFSEWIRLGGVIPEDQAID